MSDRDKDEYKITVKKNKEGDGLTIIVGKDIARYIIEAAKIKHFSLSDTIRDATIGYYYRITDNVKKQYLSDNQKQFIRRLSDILINANCIIRLISKDHTIYPELIKAEAEKLNKIIKESE